MRQKKPKLDGKVNRETPLKQFEIASELKLQVRGREEEAFSHDTGETLPVLASVNVDEHCNYPAIRSGMEKQSEVACIQFQTQRRGTAEVLPSFAIYGQRVAHHIQVLMYLRGAV